MESAGRAQFTDASLGARVALAIGATLVFLALLELGARGLERIAPPNASLLPEHASKRIALPDPVPGAYRIHLYGGSTIAGAPVRELSFAAQLEFWLRRLAPDRPVQIVNFGVNGRPSAFVLEEVERSLSPAPDLAIVLTAHNEFLGWERDGRWETLRERTGDVLEQTALARTLRRAGRRLSALRSEPEPIRRPLWIAPQDRQSPQFRERVATFQRNTRAIAARAREASVPLIFATGPANLADWPPVHRFLYDADYGRRVEALRDRIEQGELDAADDALAELRADHPDDAMVRWLEGRIAAARGRYIDASARFDEARDADPLPWRVLGSFNDHVRRLALMDGVYVADVDRAFRRHADRGLVGWELIADNCHPTPFGGALLVRELLGVMAYEDLLIRDLDALPPLERQWQVFRDAVFAERSDLQLEYLLTNAAYVMKWPFYHFEAAERYLEQAAALAPDDWRIAANLGTVAVLDGRVEEGRHALERAAALHGESLRADDRSDTPYLREALAILSGELDAFVPADGPAASAAERNASDPQDPPDAAPETG